MTGLAWVGQDLLACSSSKVQIYAHNNLFLIGTVSVSDPYTFSTDPDPGFPQYGSGSRLLFNTDPDSGKKKHIFSKAITKFFVGNLFFNKKNRNLFYFRRNVSMVKFLKIR